MFYNAIQMRMAIDNLIDRVKSPRFTDSRYYDAINQAQKKVLDDRTENIKRQRSFGVQTSQRLRNELSTLIRRATGAPAGSFIPYPTQYYYLLSIENTVDGITNACRPVTYNEQGLINRNPFRRPKSDKTYFNDSLTGWTILLPTGGNFTQYNMFYIATPVVVTIGQESNKITGPGTLVIGQTYYVYDEAVHNGITYIDGATFVAVNTILTSGTVINSSFVIDSDMPSQLHEEIIRLSAAIMDGTVDEYEKENNLKQTNEES